MVDNKSFFFFWNVVPRVMIHLFHIIGILKYGLVPQTVGMYWVL